MGKKKKKDKKNHAGEELLRNIIGAFKSNPAKTFNYKQLSGLLNIKEPFEREMLSEMLYDLKKRNIIEEVYKGKYQYKEVTPYVTGKVDMTTTGAAYIVPEDGGEDIYIPPARVNNALHGDMVKVHVFINRKERKAEGEIIEVIARAKTEFVGVVQLSKKFAFLVVDNPRMPVDLYIPLESLNGAKDGEKCIAKITDWPKAAKNPIGEITAVLGKPGDNNVEMHAILADYGLPYEFPKEVEKAASDLPTIISDEEIARRRDFRDITTFTIDPADAKDFDDALSILRLDNGNWEVGVHIADVAHYVKEGSIIDKEAYSRGTSVYLVDRVVPMLPEMLSNFVCSLRPHEEKLTFSAVFEMTEDAEIKNEWFGKTIINSNHRFSYEEAQQVIETGEGEFSEEILMLEKLAKKLRKERMKKGSIDFHSIEIKFRLDEKGDPLGVYIKEIKDSNELIEDFMLLANKKVAEFAGKVRKKPFVYRIHNKPDEEKLATFTEFVTKLGYKMNVKSTKDIAPSMNKLMKDIAGKKEEGMIESLAIRTMAKAVYSSQNIGHYGLAFDYYSHFTSPIRRYPDLMVHRLLEAYLKDEKGETAVALEEKCKHASAMEKLAAEAERASIKYKQVQFLEDKVGHDFDGLISGVSEWGLFVEIIENKCEGLVRLKDISDDYYVYDEENYAIYGKRSRKRYQLGDKVRIKIKRADLVKKQLDFLLVNSPQE